MIIFNNYLLIVKKKKINVLLYKKITYTFKYFIKKKL